jgi:hypothetical protein
MACEISSDETRAIASTPASKLASWESEKANPRIGREIKSVEFAPWHEKQAAKIPC